MIYALVHYPNVDTRRINLLRKKYDPQVDLIEPHITLMFPVQESVGENNLVRHLHSVLNGRQPFPIHLQGFQKSWDDYLFLTVQEGRADIIGLHGEIYTGILAGHRNEGLAFIPHLTLGAFSKDASAYPQALEEARQLGLDYRCMLDKLNLVKVDEEKSRIVWSKEFSLS